MQWNRAIGIVNRKLKRLNEEVALFEDALEGSLARQYEERTVSTASENVTWRNRIAQHCKKAAKPIELPASWDGDTWFQ